MSQKRSLKCKDSKNVRCEAVQLQFGGDNRDAETIRRLGLFGGDKLGRKVPKEGITVSYE